MEKKIRLMCGVEIWRMSGACLRTVRYWLDGGKGFPRPYLHLACGRLWLAEEVEEWLIAWRKRFCPPGVDLRQLVLKYQAYRVPKGISPRTMKPMRRWNKRTMPTIKRSARAISGKPRKMYV